MKPVFVIRPEPGCAATVQAARDMGLAVHGFPLFAIEPRPWTCPDPERFDAILAGSANAFRHGGADLARLTALPVHAVGQVTAEAARAAGFTVATCGMGGLQQVVEGLAAPQRLLRLAGEERVRLSPPDWVMIEERVVYASAPSDVPGELAAMLEGGALVLLHSAVAASHFAAECDRLGLDRARITLATIGPRVSAAAGAGWAAIAAAQNPSDTALLALAIRMCQEPRP